MQRKRSSSTRQDSNLARWAEAPPKRTDYCRPTTPTTTTVPALIPRWVSSRHAEPVPRVQHGEVVRRGRLGGLLNEYERRHESRATG